MPEVAAEPTTKEDAVVANDAPETPSAGASEGGAPSPASPEAPAESPAAPVPEAPDVFGVFRQHSGYDFSTKYKTPEEFAKGVAHLHSLAGRKSEKEQNWDRIAQHLPEFLQWRQQQSRPQQPQAPAEPPPLFAEPQLQEGDTDWIEDDPANPGARRIARDTPAEIRKRLLDRSKFIKQTQESPSQIFLPALQRVQQEAVQQAKAEALAEMQAIWRQQQSQWEEQQLRQQIVQARQPLMLQLQNGQPVIDAATGMPVVNDYGRAYMEREQMLYQAQVPERLRDALAHEYATLKAAEGLNKPGPKQTPGSTKAAEAAGGRVNPREKTHGKGQSLADRIFADNPGLKPDDVVSGFKFD